MKKHTVKAIAAVMASLMAFSAVSAVTANVNAYWDEYGNWIDDDDLDDLDDLLVGLLIADALSDDYYYTDTSSSYNDSYLYKTSYYDTSNYSSYANTYVYYDDSDIYVGNDYYLGSVFYNKRIGYYYYYGGNMVKLGWNYTLTTKPKQTGNVVTTVNRLATNDPAVDAGLGFSAPSYSISGYKYQGYSIIGQVFETKLKNETTTNYIYIRKARGYNDISGDESGYDLIKSWKIGNATVTIKGFRPGDYYLATWTKNGCTYSVRSDEAISLKELQRIIKRCM